MLRELVRPGGLAVRPPAGTVPLRLREGPAPAAARAYSTGRGVIADNRGRLGSQASARRRRPGAATDAQRSAGEPRGCSASGRFLVEHRLEEIPEAFGARSSATAIVNSRGRTPASARPSERRRDGRARLRPHGVDGRDRLPPAVLAVVDEDAGALLLQPLRRDEARDVALRAAATPPPRTRTSRRTSRDAGSERAHGCRRRRSSSRTRAARSPRAAGARGAQPRSPARSRRAPRAGRGRRRRSRGGRGLSTREYHGFMSMQCICTIQSSASGEFTSGKSTSRAPPSRGCVVNRRVGIQDGMPFGACFWKNPSPAIPSR